MVLPLADIRIVALSVSAQVILMRGCMWHRSNINHWVGASPRGYMYLYVSGPPDYTDETLSEEF